MKHNKNKLAMIFLISVMAISACTQSYSQAPVATPTLIPPDLFVSPFPSVENPMAMIEEFAKGTATAAALTSAVGGGITGTPGTPQVTVIVTTPVVTGTPPTFTPTPPSAVCTAPACSANQTLTCTSGNCAGGCGYVCANKISTTPLAGNIYYLQKDEFPYCIARRYNVDPDELLAASGLTNLNTYYEGQKLVIPASGSFPGDLALRSHPDTYTVTGIADTSVYGVACKYGNVDPNKIAQANGISVSAALSIGQQIKVP
jgi:hypothetical protein